MGGEKMYNQYGTAHQPLADELAVSNMITLISSGTFQHCFSDEEKKEILEAIKKHVLMNARVMNETIVDEKCK